jgi:hypothetical protein
MAPAAARIADIMKLEEKLPLCSARKPAMKKLGALPHFSLVAALSSLVLYEYWGVSLVFPLRRIRIIFERKVSRLVFDFFMVYFKVKGGVP